ncbi:MAG: hypothetical protein M1825_005423 [Sarcosagium campestre]|nr:MAG: hypothetical protein M1825_005423 [Sarcosagium campestre]
MANQFKEMKGQMDVFLRKPVKNEREFTYRGMLVIGEQKRLAGYFQAPLLQLTRYVRGIFADQPTHRFVHGFTLCASKMELWIFDRFELYSSADFDIHAEPETLVGYSTMNDDAMGLDTFIEQIYGHRYVTVEDASGDEKRMKLKQLLVRGRAIVCRGATCYRTRQNYVAKFSWPPAKRVQQASGRERCQGVAKVEAYHQITIIAELAKGLIFPKPHKFLDPFEGEASRDPPSLNDSQDARLNPELDQELQQRSKSNLKPKLYTPSPDTPPYETRLYSCLVISPAGKVISYSRPS